MTLYDPEQHEPLTDTPWDPERAQATIRAIVADTERAFSLADFWPIHPRDLEPGDPRVPVDLYLGAAGIIWALQALGTENDWSAIAASLPRRYRADPDTGDVTPGLLSGESGVLLVAREDARLVEAVRANADHPSNEILWGTPGTMLAAGLAYERSRAPELAAAWNESADVVWAAWDGDLWEQDIRGRHDHELGAAHGFAGNVLALGHGDLLDDGRRAELERRTVAALAKYARREDGLAQWPVSLESETIRTQWCHGAPGIVISVAGLAPANDELTELLVAGGELTWQAGPLRKGAGLCHGTAGNGYTFLKLFERTGDERWLERARAFAMHAIEQVRGGWYSLFTGDVGTALYLKRCLDATAAFPVLDGL